MFFFSTWTISVSAWFFTSKKNMLKFETRRWHDNFLMNVSTESMSAILKLLLYSVMQKQFTSHCQTWTARQLLHGFQLNQDLTSLFIGTLVNYSLWCVAWRQWPLLGLSFPYIVGRKEKVLLQMSSEKNVAPRAPSIGRWLMKHLRTKFTIVRPRFRASCYFCLNMHETYLRALDACCYPWAV